MEKLNRDESKNFEAILLVGHESTPSKPLACLV